ncbi:hypothetical protein AAFF_G00214140 [Aldrovandia affinis]|uniref:Uncharacterized protein n=1 Tax=Aldrovandia affinis TaxID=143900 RepID=A0AAD7RGM0_9TELE|nr:hypothetical protein AAFF_G00214140 [Aldrovandia affinis]
MCRLKGLLSGNCRSAAGKKRQTETFPIISTAPRQPQVGTASALTAPPSSSRTGVITRERGERKLTGPPRGRARHPGGPGAVAVETAVIRTRAVIRTGRVQAARHAIVSFLIRHGRARSEEDRAPLWREQGTHVSF